MSAFETADIVLTVITVPFLMWYGCTSWAYWVPPLKKGALEKTGIEIPLPDSLWRASLNLVLAPVSDMWTQYWAIEWSVFGVLVHAVLVLFLGSLFKTQAKEAQWLLLRVFGYLGTIVSWMFEFISAPSTPAVAPATKKTAPDAAPAPVKKARGKSPGPAPAAAAPDASVPAAPAAPVPGSPAAPAKKARAASARAKSPRAKAPKKTGINIGDSVLARHADGHKYNATVTAINGDSYVIAWQDDDPTDTVKTLKEMKLFHDE
jgi:hypothetical protein